MFSCFCFCLFVVSYGEMKSAISIETTIESYIAARPSRQAFLLGCQRLTRRWWREKRREYELFTSDAVIEEASHGDATIAKKRVRLLRSLNQLASTNETDALGTLLLDSGIIPPAAAGDAMHVAISTIFEMDYLLTWNCTHLANVHVQGRIEKLLATVGHRMPKIITPIQLDPHLL